MSCLCKTAILILHTTWETTRYLKLHNVRLGTNKSVLVSLTWIINILFFWQLIESWILCILILCLVYSLVLSLLFIVSLSLSAVLWRDAIWINHLLHILTTWKVYLNFTIWWLFQKVINDVTIPDRRDLYLLLTAVDRARGKTTLNEKEELSLFNWPWLFAVLVLAVWIFFYRGLEKSANNEGKLPIYI